MSKVQLVRLWLAVAASFAAIGIGIATRDPTWAIVPFAFFPGQSGCFCCAGSECPLVCSTFPTTLTVTVSGMADAVCVSCEAYDGTYVVNQNISLACIRQFAFTGPCQFAGTGSFVTTSFYQNGANIHISIDIGFFCTASFGGDIQRFDVMVAAGAPADCTISSPTNVPFQTSIVCPSGGQRCDGSGATCTVAP